MHNGRQLSCSGMGDVAAVTAGRFLDPTNAQLARLDQGLTISMWLRFNDPRQYDAGRAFSMVIDDEVNFIQPFLGRAANDLNVLAPWHAAL
eukprot:1435243-Prymnesium_polylepis.1